MTGAQHLYVNGLNGGLAAYRLVLLMPHGDDRNHNLLQHGTTMNEACTTREMKAVGSFGNPEFHAAFGHSGDQRGSVPGPVSVGQVMADQIAFLGHDRARWLLRQGAPVRCPRSGLRK